jgi:hypothetical protein
MKRNAHGLSILVAAVAAATSLAAMATEDRTPKPIPAATFTLIPSELDFLSALTRDVIRASRVEPGAKAGGSPANTSGFALIMPGGRGGYPAFWIRDFAMSLESGFISTEEMRRHLLLTAKCQNGPVERKLRRGLRIPPHAIPDHINFDGGAVFYPGTYSAGEDQGGGAYGILPPMDDHYEFAHIAYCLFKAGGTPNFLREEINGIPLLDRLAEAFDVPLAHPDTGITFTDADQRAVGFGFCDAIVLTGDLLFPSLLRYRAAGELAELCEASGRREEAAAYRRRQRLIRDNLPGAFSDRSRASGWMLAATGVGRQPDVWGTLYALHLGALEGEPAERALDSVLQAARQRTIVFEGAVRHVPTDRDFSPASAWEQTAGVTVNTYQNGAYWHTPTGWLIAAVRRRDPGLAAELVNDYIRHLRQQDFRRGADHGAPWECFSPGAYKQNGVYMTSVALPWSVLRSLR